VLDNRRRLFQYAVFLGRVARFGLLAAIRADDEDEAYEHTRAGHGQALSFSDE
jgi:hypothetical protein